MGKNLYSDFAVLTAAGRAVDFTQVAGSLRIIPLFDEISLVDAMKGLKDNVMGIPYYSGFEGDPGVYVPLNAAGSDVSNVTIQHDSDGYVRFVGKLQVPNVEVDPEQNPDPIVISHVAKGFALVDLSRADSSPEQGHIYGEIGGKSDDVDVLAVASIDRGYDMGNECYVSFTITTVNNYKSVTFNPNAFATMEDLTEINGLDGLHIAFDTNSGDIKLLDKDGKVLDQANLHMDADTIIADGEEGYKYVKTDRDQDIHSTKSFMPKGMTSGEDVEAQDYEMVSAALLLDLSEQDAAVTAAQEALDTADGELADAQEALATAQANVDADDGSDPEHSSQLAQDLETAQGELESAQSAVEEARMSLEQAQEAVEDAKQAARNGDFSDVRAIRVLVDNEPTDYFIGGEYNNTKIGASNVNFLTDEAPGDTPELTPVYSPAAFVWTVGKDVGGEPDVDLTFAQQMNANAQALGFHIGDDIPLGTNLSALIAKMSEGDFDAEAYMHDIIEMNDEEYTVDELVDEQRNLAKAELVAWNSQHPALTNSNLDGTIISENGVDIKNGKLAIGNGLSAAGPNWRPAQYELTTNFGEAPDDQYDNKGTTHANGLQIGVIDSSYGGDVGGVARNILTINSGNYISGAPICLALMRFNVQHVAGADEPAHTFYNRELLRITANFNADIQVMDKTGELYLHIVDNRPDVEHDTSTRVIEIIPVYRPGADMSEAVPALQSVHAIGQFGGTTPSCTVKCSQILDWASSIGVGEGALPGTSTLPNLYLIVKVY